MGAAETCLALGLCPAPGILQVCWGPPSPALTPSELALAGWSGLTQDSCLPWPLSRRQGARGAKGLSNSFPRANSCPAPGIWFPSQAWVALCLVIPDSSAHCMLALFSGLEVPSQKELSRGVRRPQPRCRSYVGTLPPTEFSEHIVRPLRAVLEFC